MRMAARGLGCAGPNQSEMGSPPSDWGEQFLLSAWDAETNLTPAHFVKHGQIGHRHVRHNGGHMRGTLVTCQLHWRSA